MTRRPVNPIRRAEALDDERAERMFMRVVIGVSIASAVVGLTFAGAVIWGVVALVQHYTN